jgi:hypothetical protein
MAAPHRPLKGSLHRSMIFRSARLRSTGRCFVWLLVLVLPLQGLALNGLQALGPSHVHMRPATDGSIDLLPFVDPRVDPLAAALMFVGSGHMHDAAGAHARPHVHPHARLDVERARAPFTSRPHSAAHGHHEAERHHHASSDASVVVAEADRLIEAGVLDDAGQSGDLPATFLPLVAGSTFLSDPGSGHALRSAAAWVPKAVVLPRVERPPQAG